MTSTTLGGILPPAYLVDLYAKASRGGRVFANEVNNGPLPDVGMTVIIPRLTQGLAAAAQTTQNTAVVTQDVTETDLTVNVNTIAGYSPVSRQGIERAAYSDQILFEDLTARYWSALDSYCINGTGSNNQPLGLLQTSSISTSTASTATVTGIYPKIADLIQQISTAVGGSATWRIRSLCTHGAGAGSAALDTTGRPLILPSGPRRTRSPTASLQGYGLVGQLYGLDLYVDANIPTTLGATTNTDAIIVIASEVVHLLERPQDPSLGLRADQRHGLDGQLGLLWLRRIFGWPLPCGLRSGHGCGVGTSHFLDLGRPALRSVSFTQSAGRVGVSLIDRADAFIAAEDALDREPLREWLPELLEIKNELEVLLLPAGDGPALASRRGICRRLTGIRQLIGKAELIGVEDEDNWILYAPLEA